MHRRRPRAAAAAARRGTASAFASSSRSCGSSAQAAPASSNERAEDALVAGERARVGLGGRGARRATRPAFSTATPMPARAQRSSAAHQRGAVAVVLEVERDRAHAVALGERREEVGGVEHRLVAARDDGVQPQPAARGERVDGDVAALRDQRDRARLARRDRVAPQRDAVGQRDDPVAVRPAHGQPCAAAATSSPAASSAARLGEARREHDRAAAAERAAPRSTTAGASAAGIATTTASGASGRSSSDGYAAHAVHARRAAG